VQQTDVVGCARVLLYVHGSKWAAAAQRLLLLLLLLLLRILPSCDIFSMCLCAYSVQVLLLRCCWTERRFMLSLVAK
jgi:hypothetical protein